MTLSRAFAVSIGLASFAVLCSDATAQNATGAKAASENTATKPASKPQEFWMTRHQSFVDRAKKGGVDVLFVGDSITQGWERSGKAAWDDRFTSWNPANFGIGGDRTEHVLWRITEGKELIGIDPKVIVLMIGTNNFGSNTADEIAAGVTAIVAEFRKQEPQAKVLLLGVFPRSAQPGREIQADVVTAANLHPKSKEVNAKIAKLADGKNVKYLDIGAKFLNAKGDLEKAVMPDYLHLSPAGYKAWADAIEGPVSELLKK